MNTINYEAFIYLWYVAKYRMFYLGVHKGTPDDLYTHSSKDLDFCRIVPPYNGTPIIERRAFMVDMPKGVRRRILAYGTWEEMNDLEVKLLCNRKERCWENYYNIKSNTHAIGDLRDVLSPEAIKLWHERQSAAHKGKPKPGTSKNLKKYMQALTDEERKKTYGHPGEKAYNWKGGISIGENSVKYQNDIYLDKQKLTLKLLEEGLSYWDLKDKSINGATETVKKFKKDRELSDVDDGLSLHKYVPSHLMPREEKDRKNEMGRKRYDLKVPCGYCRKNTCEHCLEEGYVLTPDEKQRRKEEAHLEYLATRTREDMDKVAKRHRELYNPVKRKERYERKKIECGLETKTNPWYNKKQKTTATLDIFM